tara:strand:+ start:1059 stop:2495 length:1437 start_codon:yes stop_codon:yes gene_type:complete
MKNKLVKHNNTKMTKKSILEEALLEVQTLEEAVKSNAKEILASTMRQEIEELVKESLTEQEEVEDYIEDTEEEELDFVSEPDELEQDFEIEDMDQEPLDLRDASDDEVLKVFKLMGSEDGIVVTQDDDVIDIKDEEVGVEYKVELGQSLENTLSKSLRETADMDEMMDMDEDEDMDETLYEVELENDEMQDLEEDQGYDDTEDESLGMRTGRESGMKQNYKARREDSYGKWGTRSETDMKEDQGYDDTEDESLGMRTGKESTKKVSSKGRRGDSYGKWGTRGNKNEVEANEASRTYGFGSKKGRGLRKGFTDNRNLTFKEGVKPTKNLTESTKRYNQLLEHAKTQDSLIEKLMSENKSVKAKSKQFKKALGEFRAKIQEVAVFNTNLAYATKLFTEHTTSKVEKINIMRRFDEVENLNESKNLFKQLNSEFDSKTKNVVQSLKKKITKAPTKGSTNLIESKIYESPQIGRIRDMMSKL